MMKELNVKASLVTYRTFINGCISVHQPDIVIQLLQLMKQEHITLDVITSNKVTRFLQAAGKHNAKTEFLGTVLFNTATTLEKGVQVTVLQRTG